jgi:lipopolysaccharide export system protein LptA
LTRDAAVGALVVVLAAWTPARALAQGIDLSGGGPVEVTSRGGFEWRENEQKVIASGDARAVRDNVTVTADRLIAYYRKKAGTAAPPPASANPPAALPPPGATGSDVENGSNEVYRLEAEGNVHIYTPTDEAVGDRAVYDIDQAVLVMTGKSMKLTTPQQVMTARDSMEYWSQRHMAVGRGNAVVVTTDGRRLSGDVLVGFTKPPDGSPAAKPVASPPVATNVAATNPKPPADPIAASGKLERVEAYGNVEVRTQVDIGRGDRGLYLPDTGIARLIGHVRLTHGQDQMNGPAADVNMKSGIGHIIAMPGQRVQGLIIPNDTSAQTRKPGSPIVPPGDKTP